jgi:hypothetical protein
LVNNSIDSLYKWVHEQQYIGWDPYDALNSKLVERICKNNPYLEILITQIIRISPINLRPLLRIEKGNDLKAIAIFVRAYSKLYNTTGKKEYLDDMKILLCGIKERSMQKKYGLHCWASHYFRYRGADITSELNTEYPDTIGTCQAIIALVEGHKILNDDNLKEIAMNSWKFLTKNLLETNGEDWYLRYAPNEENRIVINASAHGLEAGCHLLSVCEGEHTEEIKQICSQLARFLIKTQNNNGSWDYSIYNNGKIRKQLDFHQGFIIDGLMAYLPYAFKKEAILSTINKGARFYKDSLFLDDGRSYYRYPKMYPIDIHNQAQGIISFSNLSALDARYGKLAKNIAIWTIKNMQDKTGYFYYWSHRMFRNKIAFMRWGQAWMMLALSTLLEESRGCGERK